MGSKFSNPVGGIGPKAHMPVGLWLSVWRSFRAARGIKRLRCVREVSYDCRGRRLRANGGLFSTRQMSCCMTVEIGGGVAEGGDHIRSDAERVRKGG